MRRQLTAFTLIFLPLSLWAGSDDSAQTAQDSDTDILPVVRLSPQIREQDRDRGYYQTLGCRQLGQADARSEREKQWLEERKASCLEHYRAFSPRSFQR